jgi:3-methylfumaryl-CoA hydratase
MSETPIAPTLDAEILAQWIGREQQARDLIDARHARRMQATLDMPPALEDGDALPPLWHWLYFLDAVPAGALARDGHPARGGFLPPVALPRRMWAGGRVEFHAPIPLGAVAEKTARILAVKPKHGRSGALCFVTVRHETRVGETLCLSEEQDIVYRDDPAPGAPRPAPPAPPEGAVWRESFVPSTSLLFRYSALTFNAHRIHYDRPYALEVEGYPALVFHGPLTATLLIRFGLERLGAAAPRRFAYRGAAPLFDDAPFTLNGRPEGAGAALWAETPDGGLAMSAELEV